MSTVRPAVILTGATALAAAIMRVAGAAPVADVLAIAYMAVATLACAPSWASSRYGTVVVRNR